MREQDFIWVDLNGDPMGTNVNPVVVTPTTFIVSSLDLVEIAGTPVANQGNAPGWMPSALGDQNGFGIDGSLIGDDLAGLSRHGLVTLGQTYDGFGNPIFGWDVGNAGFALSQSLDAVRGVATYPAFNPLDGLASSEAALFQGVAAQGIAFSDVDNSSYALTLSYDGDGADSSLKSALDTSLIFWGPGGTAVAPAHDILGGSGFANGDFMPGVASLIMFEDAFNQSVNVSASDPLPVTGSFSSTMTSTTDTYLVATAAKQVHLIPAKNFTWQVRSDDPVSIGLTFTSNLYGSIDNGASYVVLGTKTEADVTSPPTTISNTPEIQYATDCPVLVLGATATYVATTVVTG